MLRMTLGLPAGIGMLIAGQVEPITESFPYADLVLNGGALAVLAWAVWHAYKTVIPEMRRELREDREGYTASMSLMQQAHCKTLNTMADRHERAETETADRHERWEAQRHEDADKLQEALSELSVTCAKTRARLEMEGAG